MKKHFKNLIKNSYFFLLITLIYLPLLIVVLVSLNGSSSRGNISALDFGNVLNPNPDSKSAYLRLGETDFATPLIIYLL